MFNGVLNTLWQFETTDPYPLTVRCNPKICSAQYAQNENWSVINIGEGILWNSK